MTKTNLYLLFFVISIFMVACKGGQKESSKKESITETSSQIKADTTEEDIINNLTKRYTKLGVTFTSEQLTKVKELVNAALPDLKANGKDAIKNLRQKINTSILTPEQNQLIGQFREKNKG